MKIHYFQHVSFESLGSIEDWALARGHRLSSTRFFADDPLPRIEEIDWLIVMGGPMNIYEIGSYPWLTREKQFIELAIENNRMVLGICLGAQLIADVLGARVYRNTFKEIGWFPVAFTPEARRSPLFGFLPAHLDVLHWHGDTFCRMARCASPPAKPAKTRRSPAEITLSAFNFISNSPG